VDEAADSLQSLLETCDDVQDVEKTPPSPSGPNSRKEAKKAMKLARRAAREGRALGTKGQKACDLCSNAVDLLIRCRVDASNEWKMVCGKCWNLPEVAGGVVDGDGGNQHYRYGGLWKNRNALAAGRGS